MSYEFLKTSTEDRVAWLEYRRPPLNAIDWTMLRARILAAREGERPGRGLVDPVVGDCPVCVASPEHDTPHVQIAGPEKVEDIVVVNYVSCVGQHQANGRDSVLGQATPRRPDVVVGDRIVIDA